MTRLILAAIASCSLPAQAVVIASGDGSGNTAAPPDDPGFAHVGIVNSASAIYLGNQWVLTAYHVAGSLPSSASFGGTSYATQAGSWQRLTNNGEATMSTFTDIVLFRLASDPGLGDLSVRSTPTVAGDDLVMIGRGRNRQTSETHWNVTVNPGSADDVWTEVTPPPPADRSGFPTTSTKTIRWGENEITDTSINVDTGLYGHVRSFSTTFDQSGFTHEAQGVSGDSGGAVFFKDGGGSWLLTGMMDTVGLYETQPGGATSALFGNLTYSADLTFYKTQIDTIVATPEPAVLALLLPALALLFRRRL